MTSIIKFFRQLSLILVCSATQLIAQNHIVNHLGEQLNYRMEFLGLPAGSISFDVVTTKNIDSISLYHLKVKAQTNKLFSPLFGIQNKYESYFDTSTFLPQILKKDVKQKNIVQHFSINFNQQQNKASINDSTSWNIPDSCYSFFSMLYFLRNQYFLIGDTIKFNLDSENLASTCKATLANSKIISTPAGKFKAIEVKLSFKPLTTSPRPWKTDLMTNRMANPNSKMSIWLSDDQSRLPLIIQFSQKRSKVKLVLKQFRLAQNK